MPPTSKPATPGAIAIIWDQFSPYHMDRCEAVGKRMNELFRIYGIEIASQSNEYAWAPTGQGIDFCKLTLFPGKRWEEMASVRRLLGIACKCVHIKAKYVFTTNYHRPENILLTVLLRLLGFRVFLMSDSKFDDFPRQVWRELLKSLILWPYCGALAAGTRAKSYLQFLGFRQRPIVIGLSTVSLDRLVVAGGPAAPAELEFDRRYFVLVGRFIPEKDISTAIAAYASYRGLVGESVRELHICGSGPLEKAIHEQVSRLELQGVVFHGFVQSERIAGILAGGLALILPSVKDTWGLVVNEALAFNLPILTTDRVGARDLLVRTSVNGYIFEAGNTTGLAQLMCRLSGDEGEWRRLVAGSRELRRLADVARFAEAVEELLGLDTPSDRRMCETDR